MTDRQAAERPAVPWEGTEHPGDKGDPNREEYAKGDPSAWAEDPREPPYPKGERPSVPWEGTEHPAAKEAAMQASAEKRAAKCVKLAEAMFRGKKVAVSMIEDQALEFMDLGDSRIKSALERLEAGGFLADEFEEEVEDEEAMLAQMLEEEEEFEMDPMARKFAEMEAKIAELEGRVADQNKSDSFDTGFDVSDGPKTADDDEEAEDDECEGCKKAEEEKEALLDVSMGHNVFDEYDFDGDGFITMEEWGGSPAVFAAIDTDGDGIITMEEAAAGLGDSFSKFALKKAQDEDEEADDDSDEASKKKAGDEEEEEEADKEAAKKSEDDDDDDSDSDESDDSDDDSNDDSDDSEDDSDDDDGDDEAEASKKAGDDEEEEEADKEAAVMDDAEGEAMIESLGQDMELDIDVSPADDPMGLEDDMEEDAELAALFGLKNADEKPQPKKASGGVKALGSVAKTAGNNEATNLEKLWDDAPDVSEHFK